MWARLLLNKVKYHAWGFNDFALLLAQIHLLEPKIRLYFSNAHGPNPTSVRIPNKQVRGIHHIAITHMEMEWNTIDFGVLISFHFSLAFNYCYSLPCASLPTCPERWYSTGLPSPFPVFCFCDERDTWSWSALPRTFSVLCYWALLKDISISFRRYLFRDVAAGPGWSPVANNV